jgi:hypothetical protein
LDHRSCAELAAVEAYLSDEFLDRVRSAYRRAIASAPATSGIWAALDKRRTDVDAALRADSNNPLRSIFNDPTSTDLYYGVDRLCRSHVRLNDPSEFVVEALNKRDPRARSAAYQIDRIRELNPGLRSIVEIGPGMGRAAYYGHRAGLDYATIDLPLGVVAQACFLGRALGPDSIWFAGEDEAAEQRRIKLFYEPPDCRFDAALNVDSITEMPAVVAFDYFRWAAEHVGLLLSINHQQNPFTVAQLAVFAAPYRSVMRRPCPTWDGYVEEAFTLAGLGELPRAWRLAAFKALLIARRGARGVARRYQAAIWRGSIAAN